MADYSQIVAQASAQSGVPSSLISSVIAAESSGNPFAVSKAGAQGLMQLEPGTASDLGVSNVFDPEENIMAGATYLAQLLQRFGGSVSTALAAYDFGQGNVSQGKAWPAETQSYVSKVLAGAGLSNSDNVAIDDSGVSVYGVDAVNDVTSGVSPMQLALALGLGVAVILVMRR